MATAPKTKLTPIADILKKSLKHLNLDEKFKVYPIWKNWEHIVGEAIAKKTQPHYVIGDTLYIGVCNHVWMSELERQKQALLEKITEHSPHLCINHIRFRLQNNQ